MKHKIYVLSAIFRLANFMKKLNIAFLTLLLVCGASDVSAQSKSPRTIEDFYLALPAKYIQPLASVKDRRKLVKTRDAANGYLYLSGAGSMPDWEGWAEVALFKKTNGEYLIGVVDGSCATFCYSGIEFLEYKNGKWTEVTSKVLPEITVKMTLDRYRKIYPNNTEYDEQNPPHTNYELPQKGTTVKLNANGAGEDDTLLFELVWNGKRFELKKQ